MKIAGKYHSKTHFLTKILLFGTAFSLMFALSACSSSKTEAKGANENRTQAESAIVSDGSYLKVKFIDVGQADSALIECDGQFMLIDGGNKGDSDVVYSVLDAEGVKTLEAVVATHSHEDHIGGLPAAFKHGEVKRFFGNGSPASSKAYYNLMSAAEDQGLTETVPSPDDPSTQTFMLGAAKCTFVNVPGKYSDENDKSLVIKIEFGETSFLFTGDASQEAEKAMVESGADLSATVLKVGHHGSDTATGYVFLREVMPEISVISVGKENKYGHPTEDVLSRLRDEGCEVYRTDESGDIVLTSDGKTVSKG